MTSAWTGSQFGAIFWWTHGSATSAADIMNLSNAAKLDNTHPGFTFQCSCTNSHPETTNNLAYSLLKNGAIATVGATRVSWYYPGQTSYAGSSTNSGMTYEYAKRLIENDMRSCGYALHDMKQTLTPRDTLWMNFTDFCIYGDPEVSLIDADNDPVLSVTPLSREVSKSSGTTTFNISNSGKGTMIWSAESNASWLTLRENSGTDNAIITVNYDATSTDRTGKITITAEGAKNSPKTVEVKQTEVEWQLYDDFEEEVINEKWTKYGINHQQCDYNDCYEYKFDTHRLELMTNSEHSTVWPYPYNDTYSNVGINTAICLKNAQLPIGVKADFTIDANSSIDAVNTQSLMEIRFKSDSGAKYAATIGFQYHVDTDSYYASFHCYKDPEYTPLAQNEVIEKEVFLGKTVTFSVELANQGANSLIANAFYIFDNQTYNFTSFDFISNFKNETFQEVIGDKSITVNISNGMSLRKPITLTDPTSFVKDVRDLFQGKELILYVDNVYIKSNSIMTVTPEFQNVPATSGTTTFTVKNIGAGMMNWTAVENADWFSVSPTSETNGETLTITYDENTGNERTGEIIITAGSAENSPQTIGITQSRKEAGTHFTPVWTGNPYNAMRLWVDYASIDGIPLSIGDEIAVFDGNKCVGSGIVTGEISAQNPLDIKSSADDGSGNGFTNENQISIRFWDSSARKEYTQITASFKNATDGKPLSDAPTFKENEDFGVSLEYGGGQQSIALVKGWNIMSSYIVPEDTDMMTVVQPLIDSGCLEKVISESGGTVIKVFGNWKNTIGNYDPDEGYKVKLTCDTDFSVKGFSMMSQSNMYATSQSISLTAGWNIISYPYPTSQDAMTAFQSLIDSGNLIKVIDETGATLIKVFGTWRNNIGDLRPGEGYEIKVGTDTTLMLKEASSPRSKNLEGFQIQNLEGFDTVHFVPVWTGNSYNPMELWIFDIKGHVIENGDEIGIFDSDRCVGVGVVSAQVSLQNPLRIVTSQDDNDDIKGFVEGNDITIKFWDSDSNIEIPATTSFTDMNENPIPSVTFKGLESYGVTLTLSGTTEFTLNDAITALKILAGINANPANTNADADGNGRVELADVVFILQVVSGIR